MVVIGNLTFSYVQLKKPNPMVFLVLALLFSQITRAARPAPADLVERFLTQQQLVSIELLEGNLANFRAGHNCLKDEAQCSNDLIQSMVLDAPVEMEFNQQDLMEYVLDAQKFYRFVVGLHSFHAIQRGLGIGMGRMSITPINGAAPVNFETKTEAGKEEWETIKSYFNGELGEIDEFNDFLTAIPTVLPEATQKSMRSILASKISTMNHDHPFLRFLGGSQPSLKKVRQAFRKVEKSYIKSLTHIATLEGEDRTELFGFLETVEETLSIFSDEEQARIEEHYEYIRETTTLWKQFLAAISTTYFRVILFCAVGALVFPPLALICVAVSSASTTYGAITLLNQYKRLRHFKNTGKFDHETYRKAMAGVLLSTAMLAIVVRGAAPTLVRNATRVRREHKNMNRRIRMRGFGVMGYSNKLRRGLKAMMTTYLRRYVQDYGSDFVVDSAMYGAERGTLYSFLPNFDEALDQLTDQFMTRKVSTMLYSDYLKFIRTAL